ncbi:hypothetical protein [Candidatus Contendibacter odensensis]|uniref:DUF3311 domain-containing protein n=1 Tax=Candidatus Contendobacter odensis Run_B_J11 TaxID=1400861 RepID=A0A7U7GEX2_9GAMM|nr:hypothetical protein [Candidatus Contendobacter odensis]MBK8752502.1 hypothetical protein [Candidatus Competibacteraceae bacterium]CDH47004.1 hypothetical protein BN874_690054 [Candidatus Contendobacter odensis Run_B_J11]
MRQQSKESIIILFISAVLALNYPFLGLFDRTWMPFGIPLLYLYLYLVWFLIIVLLIAIVERSKVREPNEHGESGPSAPAPAAEPASRIDTAVKAGGGNGSVELP